MEFLWLRVVLLMYGVTVSGSTTTESTQSRQQGTIGPNSTTTEPTQSEPTSLTPVNKTIVTTNATTGTTVGSTATKLTQSQPTTPTPGCSSPELPNGDVQFSNSTWIGSVATFTCTEKYYIDGFCTQNITSTCLQNETWSVSVPSCVPKDAGVSFSLSKETFIEGSHDLITMTCNSTMNISNFQFISIRRKFENSWETIATLTSDNKTFHNNSSNFSKKMTSSGVFIEVPILKLVVNESDLTCEDVTLYQCHVEYTNQFGQCYGEDDKEFKGFFLPKVVTIEGRKSGVLLENYNRSFPAQLKKGDTLDLNCTANIGSNPNGTISWLSNTAVSNGEPIPNKISGNSTQGSAIEDGDCRYTRSNIINHTIDTSDASVGNISYECQVNVQTPEGSSKTVESDDILFVEIYEVCPRPSPILNGIIVITGTGNGSRAEVTCDDGYQRTTRFATCTSSGNWDAQIACNKIDCMNFTTPSNGKVTYNDNKNTFFGDSVQITCDDDYILKGQNSSVCQVNGQWSNTNSTCVLKGCELPSPPKNGFVRFYDNTTFVNDSVLFSCYPGYNLNGAARSTCTSTYTWTADAPSCIIKNCTLPPAVQNGFYTATTTLTANSTTNLSCRAGYKLSGNGTITCLVNGTVIQTSANCSLIECPSPIAPDNGLVRLDSGGRTINKTISYSCYPGYKLDGSDQTSCTLNGTWQDVAPLCIVKNCSAPVVPTNGHLVNASGQSVNSTADIVCNEGYSLTGSDTRIECLENSTWSRSSTVCNIKKCARPSSPENGQVDYDNGKVEVNDTVTFSCFHGYQIIGKAHLKCNSNGSWDATLPSCIVQNCSSPVAPLNGNIVNISGRSVNSTADIACNEGYSLHGNDTRIECLENRKWSRSSAICDIKRCSTPLAPDNGQVDIYNKKMTVNDTVTFSCNIGYKLTGKRQLKCNSDGNWDTSLPTCVIQNCSTPVDPANGYVTNVSGQSVNSTADIACNEGYSLHGNDTRIKCLENSTWSKSFVDCIVKECPMQIANDDFENGYIISRNNSAKYKVNDFADLSCHPGYILNGATTAVCNADGNWNMSSTTTCIPKNCGKWTNNGTFHFPSNELCDVSYSPNTTTFRSKAICSCKHGYQINSTRLSIATECNSNGSWSILSPPLCTPIECPYLNVSDSINVNYSDFEYNRHLVDTVATFSCKDTGFSIVGHETVICLTNGRWSGPVPTCKEIDRTVLPCQTTTDDHKTLWNETPPGVTSRAACPNGTDGVVSRLCTEQGKWQLPIYACVRTAIADLDKSIEAIKDNPSEADVDNALTKLTEITSTTTSENKDGMLSGELEKVTSILETIVNISNKNNVTDTQAEAFLSTTSNLLDAGNAESWNAISQTKDSSPNNKQPSAGANKILDVVSRYSDAVVGLLNNTKNESKTIKAPNLVLHVVKIKENSSIDFPGKSSNIDYKSSFHLLSESLKGLTHVSSVLYKNLSGILSSRSISDGNGSKPHHINSEVVAVKIPNWERNIKKFKLTLSFNHFRGNNYVSPECSFWDEKRGAWNNSGCNNTEESNKTNTVCECNHLTNFAILMSPWISENVDTRAIDVISTVGCSISLVALVITIAFHIALWRYVKSDRVVILIHLSVALVISYAVFLGGVDRTENKDACTAVAVLLQYIYLVVFFLMLAEGIEIAVSVLYVFTTASRLKWILPAAWLIPAVIVGISLGATQLRGYGNEQYCWLSVEGGVIAAFVAPAFIIIVVNFVLLVLVLRAAFGARTLAEKSKSERTKAGVKCLCVLLPLMGCTWVIGIFYVNKDMAWIQYVFAVCNSLQMFTATAFSSGIDMLELSSARFILQVILLIAFYDLKKHTSVASHHFMSTGLVIFIFHCALNKQIRMAIERRRSKYASSLLNNSSSTKKFSMPRVSTSSISDRMDTMSNSFSRDNVSFKSRTGSEMKSTTDNTYEMMSTNSLHSSLMQKRL